MKRAISVMLSVILLLSLYACGKKETAATWQEKYDLGVRYLSEGNYEEAIIAFTAAIEIDPKHQEAYISLADAYIGLGDYDKARSTLQKGREVCGDLEDFSRLEANLSFLESGEVGIRITELYFDKQTFLSGGETDFLVSVAYQCPEEECILMIGANTYEADSFRMMDEDHRVTGGGGYQFQVSLTPVQWDDAYFGIYVNLSEADHEEKWTPFASDTLFIDPQGNVIGKLENDQLNEADSEASSTVESELEIDHGQADELQIANEEAEPARDTVPPEEKLTSNPETEMSQSEGQNETLGQTEQERTSATEASSTVDSGVLNGGDITWALDNTGLLSVSGNGELAQYNKATNLAPWNAYTESIKRVVITDGLTGLGSWGFSDCKSLTDIAIANTVSFIGTGTFSGCRRLTSVILPSGLENVEKSLFDGCSSLKTVVIPNGVQQIYDLAFHNCKSLTSIEIPDGVTDIRSSAFAGCEALTHITIPASTTFIGEYAFANCNALIDVYYQGTSAEWDVITIRNGNDALTGATIHFQG